MTIGAGLAVPSYGAMALKRIYCPCSSLTDGLAVPSYGAMALKPRVPHPLAPSQVPLAVPSYGAMALKPPSVAPGAQTWTLAVPSYGAMALKPRDAEDDRTDIDNLQSPPTGRWP